MVQARTRCHASTNKGPQLLLTPFNCAPFLQDQVSVRPVWCLQGPVRQLQRPRAAEDRIFAKSGRCVQPRCLSVKAHRSRINAYLLSRSIKRREAKLHRPDAELCSCLKMVKPATSYKPDGWGNVIMMLCFEDKKCEEALKLYQVGSCALWPVTRVLAHAAHVSLRAIASNMRVNNTKHATSNA
jgi:hypothetical protein